MLLSVAAGIITGKGSGRWDPAWGPRPPGFEAPKAGEQPADIVDGPVQRIRAAANARLSRARALTAWRRS
jgi:hypothetical protein